MSNDSHPKENFLQKYIFSVDHKIIGLQYGITSLLFLFFGFCLMMVMRWQLAYPETPVPIVGGLLGETGILMPETYNMLGAMHGTIMVFRGIVPLAVGAFGNYIVPLQIGAPDMAFPKLNAASYWAYFVGGVIMVTSFFMPEMIIQGELAPTENGSPLLFQHLFWFFGHPEVYIVALPAFGIVSDLLSVHARKNIFGYRLMVWAIVVIGGLSFVVWAHHMYVSGMNPYFGFFFATTTLIIAVPTAIKVYNWVLTLWRGNIRLTVPMLYAIGFVFTFINGGLTGIFLGNVIVDVPLSDTYFVVAHFHMVMAVSPILAVFGAVYHWYPKITGRMLNEGLGRFHFWVTFVGLYCLYYPMHYLGILGVPRRSFSNVGPNGLPDFIPDSAQFVNIWITIAAICVASSQLVFLYNLFASATRGKPAGGNPWGATTLEWQTTNTPPTHGNFGKELPSVYRWAYDYSVPGAEEDFIPQNVPAGKNTGQAS